jgi:hypothetical protein
MPRRNLEQIVDAAHGLLADGERVIEYGPCWAAQLRDRVPLPLLGRRQYLMVLTDRRVLLFARGRGELRRRDLVIGKRYDAFTLRELRRGRPLLRLLVELPPTAVMVLEFRPRRRRVGEVLAHRLDPTVPDPAPRRTAPAAPPPPEAGRPAAEDHGFRDAPTGAS